MRLLLLLTTVPLMPDRVRVSLVQPLQKVIRLRRQAPRALTMLRVPLVVGRTVSIRLVLLPLPSPTFPQSAILLVPRLKLHLTPTVATLNRPETGLVLSRVLMVEVMVLEVLPLLVEMEVVGLDVSGSVVLEDVVSEVVEDVEEVELL